MLISSAVLLARCVFVCVSLVLCSIKKREACRILTEKITAFNEILEKLLTKLSSAAMKEERHWKRISEITGADFSLNKFHELKLKDVLSANLHKYTDEILDVIESAERQRGIQQQLLKLRNKWKVQEFKFGSLKASGNNRQDRPDVVLKGDSVQETQELLDDSITQINQLKTRPQQHIKHFAAELVLWTNQLSSVSDTLEDWVRVQQLWMALEKVFLGGDIAKQMLADARVFAQVDKEWTQRLMVKAKETRNVVECCLNEYIKNILPKMKESLERCQKALDDYLDTKRGRFARFYFVDNDSLLTFLSHSQYLEEIQGCFPKITENNIDNVTHHGNQITAINTGTGEHTESVAFPPNRPVYAKGNIEDWLNQFIKEMMRTMKEKIRQAAIDGEPLTQPNMEKAMERFINNNCAQVALLGMQFVWTRDTHDSLATSRSDKRSLIDAHARQRAYLIMLSDSTTQDIANKLERTQLETLITIQLHQVEILDQLKAKFPQKTRVRRRTHTHHTPASHTRRPPAVLNADRSSSSSPSLVVPLLSVHPHSPTRRAHRVPRPTLSG
jgi:dynein heavy chain, axonemal